MRKVQHATNNMVLGAPKGMSIDECDALPVTRVVDSDGMNILVSFWQPTPEEISRISRGLPVRLAVLGLSHPPVIVGVDGDDFLRV